jgi:hypothetical protein
MVAGTTTYDDGDTTIVVTTCSLDPEDEEEEDDQDAPGRHVQKSKTLLGKRASVPLGATQPKKAKSVNKPKKIVSEKRIKKLSRREKSVPKNQKVSIVFSIPELPKSPTDWCLLEKTPGI